MKVRNKIKVASRNRNPAWKGYEDILIVKKSQCFNKGTETFQKGGEIMKKKITLALAAVLAAASLAACGSSASPATTEAAKTEAAQETTAKAETQAESEKTT